MPNKAETIFNLNLNADFISLTTELVSAWFRMISQPKEMSNFLNIVFFVSTKLMSALVQAEGKYYSRMNIGKWILIVILKADIFKTVCFFPLFFSFWWKYYFSSSFFYSFFKHRCRRIWWMNVCMRICMLLFTIASAFFKIISMLWDLNCI